MSVAQQRDSVMSLPTARSPKPAFDPAEVSVVPAQCVSCFQRYLVHSAHLILDSFNASPTISRPESVIFSRFLTFYTAHNGVYLDCKLSLDISLALAPYMRSAPSVSLRSPSSSGRYCGKLVSGDWLSEQHRSLIQQTLKHQWVFQESLERLT